MHRSRWRPPVVARAPVRISLGGGGTDLAAYYHVFGGFVLSTAITRCCYVAANDSPDGTIRISSADYRRAETFAPGELPPVSGPLALPQAAIEWFARRELLPRGVDLFLAAEVPPGTGLGSSSAMAVALIQALAAYTRLPLTTAAIAELACALEIERLGQPIGKQDQYASAYGGLNTITFAADRVTVTPLGLRPEVAAALDARLLLFATGQRRDSADILREQRADSRSKPVVIDGLHRIKALAEEMRRALVAEELDQFGDLLDQAWQAKRGLSGKVSSAAIDTWYERARAAGALGGKIAGAGGGGFLLLYVPPERQAAVRAALGACGLDPLPFGFDPLGVRALGPARARPPARRLIPRRDVTKV